MTCLAFFSNMKRFISLLLLSFISVQAFCCTSLIISGRYTVDGRPVMMKNRDTGELNNRISYYKGPLYSFIGLEDSPAPENGVWTGTNSVGFSIMNTASYNIKDDDVADDLMDKEGILMFKALGSCRDIKDFENLLDTLSRPMGVEANFGVIDAYGGAAYYEVNNHSWIKYDVNMIPEGYKVVTNFSESGPREKYEGYERYITATSIVSELYRSGRLKNADHSLLINSLSRSYRHEILGMDYVRDYDILKKNTSFSGTVVDQDFIPRRITSAVIVIEGVKPGEDPQHTVMWTAIGYPSSTVYVPLLVGKEEILPSYVKGGKSDGHSVICDEALDIKSSFIFNYDISNGSHYLRLDNVLRGNEGRPSLLSCCRKAESVIDESFINLHSEWTSGNISDEEFYKKYRDISESFLGEYHSVFASFRNK